MRTLFLAVILTVSVSLNAQVKAITQNGDVVILNSNGTWVYEEDASEANAPKTVEKIDPSNNYAQSGFDIRTSNWGDSFIKVRSIENVHEDEWIEDKQTGFDIKAFETEVAGLEAVLVYYFIDDKLVCARYLIMENHSNNDDYLNDYNRLNDILSGKYGSEKIKEEWHNDNWKDSPAYKGFALKQGDITMTCSWETKHTEISHSISSRDYEIVHKVDYNSKEHGDLIDEGLNKSGSDVL